MKRPERPGEESSQRPAEALFRLGSLIADAAFKYWHGRSREEVELSRFWEKTGQLLKIDGKVADSDWVEARQAELGGRSLLDQNYVFAYGRARLEDYCRHQGELDDGRRVVRLPVFGVSKSDLAELGIEVDNFTREHVTPTSGHNYIAILPEGWTLSEVPESERMASVFDSEGTPKLNVHYQNKPWGHADDFVSRTRLPQVQG